MNRRLWLVGLIAAGVAVPATGSHAGNAQDPARPADKTGISRAVDFNRDVRPILSTNCLQCHGPDDAHREAGLRLDLRKPATSELDSGMIAVVPGSAEKSELYRRITADDADLRMPPESAGTRLGGEQIAVLKRWIDQGARYAQHWSFVAPQRPAPPATQDRDWPRNPIDCFVLSRLEAAGMKPAPEADKYMLIRRLSLDLRGIPPSPTEVRAFVNDEKQDAYERLVDRMIDDPAFGERWARLWLDLARYADSAGYGSDPLRTMWRYRDWVIQAINANMPFDQFTIEQLAGDLLPHPSPEQILATAYHRNTMTNTEGGTDDNEFRVAAVKDRIETTFQVWMGLTMRCANCHTHKYDPITQREYYRFYAYFNQTEDADLPNESPTMPFPTDAMVQENRQIDDEIAAIKHRLETPTPELAAAQHDWEESLRGDVKWTVLAPNELHSAGGTSLVALDDGSILATGANPKTETYTIVSNVATSGITAFRLEAIPDPSLPMAGSGRADDGGWVLSRFSVTHQDVGANANPAAGRYVRIELPGEGRNLSLAEVQIFRGSENVALAGMASQSSTDYAGVARLAIDGNTDGHYFNAKSTTHTKTETDPWWEVDLGAETSIDRIVVFNRTDGKLDSRLAGLRVRVLDDSRKETWNRNQRSYPDPSVAWTLNGPRPVTINAAFADFTAKDFPVTSLLKPKDVTQSGWSSRPNSNVPQSATLVTETPVGTSNLTRLTVRLEHQFKGLFHSLGRFRLSVTGDRRVRKRAEIPKDVLVVVDMPAGQRSAGQQDRLAAYYRSIAPSLNAMRKRITQLEESRPDVPTIPIMRELPEQKRRPTHVMVRGSFLNLSDAVEPGVPASFHPFPSDASPNRLGVAHWLMDSSNPLTARVTVNRYWGRLFQTGLVETEEDFGTQGEPPSHPKLLDWLATEMDRFEWDVKALLRLMVTSATYRQTSRTTPALLERDPRNRLFSRFPRQRLEAEMVRDQALALSGLLSRKMLGPSVYPPQPPGLWQAAFNGQRNWPTSKGSDRYRRGLYVFWRRTVPYPAMATFDAPSRELCTVRRSNTNTPLQAFVTMNDPAFVETAQAMGRRILREGGTTTADRVRFALLLCLGRPALPAQATALADLYENAIDHYREDKSAALQMATAPLGPLPDNIDVAEAAAWTVVANVLLNLDGVLSKG